MRSSSARATRTPGSCSPRCRGSAPRWGRGDPPGRPPSGAAERPPGPEPYGTATPARGEPGRSAARVRVPGDPAATDHGGEVVGEPGDRVPPLHAVQPVPGERLLAVRGAEEVPADRAG